MNALLFRAYFVIAGAAAALLILVVAGVWVSATAARAIAGAMWMLN